eukprot:15355968-Heterocapsa_arctica.AAC.1
MCLASAPPASSSLANSASSLVAIKRLKEWRSSPAHETVSALNELRICATYATRTSRSTRGGQAEQLGTRVLGIDTFSIALAGEFCSSP